MAKYIPDGWSMSKAGAVRFAQHLGRIETICKRRTAKYKLPAMDPVDLLQEAMMAAAYAVDTYQEGRGNLDGYISTVVSNALAMVAADVLAQRRQPYSKTLDAEGNWIKTPVHCAELEDDIAVDYTPNAVQILAAREDSEARQWRRAAGLAKLNELGLTAEARQILDLKLHPPAELCVMARNLNHGRHRIDANSMARWLGWPKQKVQKATRELKDRLYIELGVEELS